MEDSVATTKRGPALWRMGSPSALLFAFCLLPLPWVEVRCSGKDPLVMYSQSGLQACYGGISHAPLEANATAEKKQEYEKALAKLKEELADMTWSPSLVAYIVLILTGAVAGFRLKSPQRRMETVAGLAAAATVLLLAERNQGFPLGRWMVAHYTRAYDPEWPPREVIYYTVWFRLALLSTASAIALVGLESWLLGPRIKPRQTRTLGKGLAVCGTLALLSLTASEFGYPPQLLIGGLVRGERFSRGKPVSYWVDALKKEEGSKEAIAALAAVGRDVVPLLIERMEVENRFFRRRAARVLCALGPDAEEAIPALARALADPTREEDKEVKRLITMDYSVGLALAKIGPAAVPALVEALKSENDEVRRQAAWALAHMGPEAKAAAPALVEALNDRDKQVGAYAADALKEIDPEAARRGGR